MNAHDHSSGTLGGLLAHRDVTRFVGRHEELELVDRALAPDSEVNVLLVHGPGGIGKSAFLRQVARRGRSRGWQPISVDAREIGPLPGDLDKALRAAHDTQRPLILIDAYEHLGSSGVVLRRKILPGLPEETVVVVAGRGLPDPGWYEGGWEWLVAQLALPPLTRDESTDLLRAHGLDDPRRTPGVLRWADGSPLALVLAAETAASDTTWSPEAESSSPDFVEQLLRRLAANELGTSYPGVLAVAAIARVTTSDLLREALPEIDAEEAFEWLASRTFTDVVGEGVAVHDLVRRAVRADLRKQDIEHERLLRRRVTDHLFRRAIGGEFRLTIDLSELIEDDLIRSGYSWSAREDLRLDEVRADDQRPLAEGMARRGLTEWWTETERFLDAAPERVVVARTLDDSVCGYMIAVTPSSAPEVAVNDVLLGPWLAHAQTTLMTDNAVLFRDTMHLPATRGTSRRAPQALMNMVGMLRSGLTNPRYVYLPITDDPEREFAEHLGAVHLHDLDIAVGDLAVECFLVDYGEGGVLGAQRDQIYRELGLPPQPFELDCRRVTSDAVREALRAFHDDAALAKSPLATGVTPAERATSVRTFLKSTADRAFGTTTKERLLREILDVGYFEAVDSHERTADQMYLSRGTYFRRLKVAALRLGEFAEREEG
jgi:hypothetical protein